VLLEVGKFQTYTREIGPIHESNGHEKESLYSRMQEIRGAINYPACPRCPELFDPAVLVRAPILGKNFQAVQSPFSSLADTHDLVYMQSCGEADRSFLPLLPNRRARRLKMAAALCGFVPA
jgi:hypothetical protein